MPKNFDEVYHEQDRIRELEQDALVQAQQIANLQRQVLELAKRFAEMDEKHQVSQWNLDVAETLEEERNELQARVDRCEALLEMSRDTMQMVLLFYSGGDWGSAAYAAWMKLSLGYEPTTKGMCGRIRDVLKEVEDELETEKNRVSRG